MRPGILCAILLVSGCKKATSDPDNSDAYLPPLTVPFGEWTLAERTTVDGFEDLRDEDIYIAMNAGTYGFFWDRGERIGECANSGSLILTEEGMTLTGTSVEPNCSSNEIDRGEQWYGTWSGTFNTMTIDWYEGSEPAFTPIGWVLERYQ